MNKIQFLFIASLFILSAASLKLETVEHQQAITNSADYLQGLLDQQNNFEKSINQLDTNIQETVQGATSQTDIDRKISILEEGILNQQSMIYNSSTTLIPILVIKDQCVGLTDADKSNIIQRCDTAINRIKSLQQKLATLPQDIKIRELKLNADHQLQYLTALENVIKNNCTSSVILSPTVYQSNLIAPNWVAGTKGLTGITNEYIQRSLNNTNITNCPIAAPFVINGKCDNCPSGQFYDMTTSNCATCPVNTVFDANAKQCKYVAPTPTNVTNTTTPTTPTDVTNTTTPTNTTNPTNVTNTTTPTNLTNVTAPTNTTVPVQTPNATNSNSLNTTLGTQPPTTPGDIQCNQTYPYYNTDTKQCQKCTLQGQYYYFNNNSCLSPNSINPATPQQYFGTAQPVNDIRVPCPIQYPFFFNNNCHVCNNKSLYFNQQDGQCYPCKPTQTLINDTCVQNSAMPPTGTNTSALGNQSYIGQPPTTPPTKPCPTEAPFFDNVTKACTNCTQDNTKPYFDFNNQTCGSCPPPQIYDPAQHQCTLCQNGDQYDIALKTCVSTNSTSAQTKPYIGNATTTSSQNLCPEATPFYSKVHQKCIACPPANDSSLTVFDFNSGDCVACIAYNETDHTCKNGYISDVLAPNWFSQHPFTVKQDAFNKLSQGYQPCNSTTPYYNGAKCIQCFDPTPNFNFDTKQCMPCPSGTHYDVVSHRCVNDNVTHKTVVPNVTQRLIIDEPLNQVLSEYNSSTAKPCPIETPFFNGQKCINCTQPYYYFHTTELDCEYCVQNSTFSNNQCQQSGSSISPNLQSLIQNVFPTHEQRNLYLIQNVFPTHEQRNLHLHKRHSIM